MPADENDKTQSIIQNDKSKLLGKNFGENEFNDFQSFKSGFSKTSRDKDKKLGKANDLMSGGIPLSLVSQLKNEVNIEIILDTQT